MSQEKKRRMSLARFYVLLKALPRQGWKARIEEGIIKLCFETSGTDHDPVTALCLNQTGVCVSMWDDIDDRAYMLLGLDPKVASSILTASWYADRHLSRSQRKIRSSIRLRLGL